MYKLSTQGRTTQRRNSFTFILINSTQKSVQTESVYTHVNGADSKDKECCCVYLLQYTVVAATFKTLLMQFIQILTTIRVKAETQHSGLSLPFKPDPSDRKTNSCKVNNYKQNIDPMRLNK